MSSFILLLFLKYLIRYGNNIYRESNIIGECEFPGRHRWIYHVTIAFSGKIDVQRVILVATSALGLTA